MGIEGRALQELRRVAKPDPMPIVAAVDRLAGNPTLGPAPIGDFRGLRQLREETCESHLLCVVMRWWDW